MEDFLKACVSSHVFFDTKARWLQEQTASKGVKTCSECGHRAVTLERVHRRAADEETDLKWVCQECHREFAKHVGDQFV